MPLKTRGYLHDTPGFQVQNLLPALYPKERKLIIPRKAVSDNSLSFHFHFICELAEVVANQYSHNKVLFLTGILSNRKNYCTLQKILPAITFYKVLSLKFISGVWEKITSQHTYLAV